MDEFQNIKKKWTIGGQKRNAIIYKFAGAITHRKQILNHKFIIFKHPNTLSTLKWPRDIRLPSSYTVCSTHENGLISVDTIAFFIINKKNVLAVKENVIHLYLCSKVFYLMITNQWWVTPSNIECISRFFELFYFVREREREKIKYQKSWFKTWKKWSK